MKYPSSELILNADGSVFHLHLLPSQLANKVILVGDPGRVSLVASRFDKIYCEVSNREFRTVTGLYRGNKISVVSTGIGTDNIDIVLNELDALANIDLQTRQDKPEHTTLQIVRIGTSGGLQPFTPEGCFVASEMAVGFDGLLNFYAGASKVCDKEFAAELVRQTAYDSSLARLYAVRTSSSLLNKVAANDMVRGATVSAPGFYGPQGRQIRVPLAFPELNERLRAFEYQNLKICNFEMEGSAIAGLSALLGHEALTVCLIIANRYAQRFIGDYQAKMNQLIDLVLDRL